MSRFTRIALPLFAVVSLGFSALALANSPVLATVNGKTITQQDYDRFIEENPVGREVDRNEVLSELITRELVYQDATRQSLEKRRDVQQAIESARINVIMGAALEEAVSKPPVTEAELRALYDAEIARLDLTEYRARHILVSDKTEAERIITELDMGGNFAALAQQYSLDSSAENGGDLGWFNPQQMVPEFSRAVIALEQGKYTKNPVQSQFGWHVIQREDSRQGTPPPFDAVRGQLKQIIERQRLNDYLQGLQQKATINVN